MKSISSLYNLLIGCIGISILIGCASTGTPNGGPLDTKAPALVIDESDLNFSTNFAPSKLELVFDEWIELKNQSKEILISPPFFKNPKISSRGKKITIEFPKGETLRADATYTINFGKSIVDFTAGNPAEGFRFVFSTGDKIDSLTFSGMVVDAIDNKPTKEVLVLLYDLVYDSVVVKEKPFYYARTGKDGSFTFENLKNDTFKLLVLEDLNFNYLMDPELEKLAFPDSLFILNDSSNISPTLRLFKPEQRLRILNSNSKSSGKITTVFNQIKEKIDYRILYPSDFNHLVEQSKDSLFLWFTEDVDSVGIIYSKDTLDFNVKPFDSLFYSKRVTLNSFNASKTVLAPFDSLMMSFSAPIGNVESEWIRLINQPKKKAQQRTERDGRSVPNRILNDSILIEIDSIAIPIDSVDNNIEAPILDSFAIQQDTSLLLVDSIVEYFNYTTSTAIRKLILNAEWKENHEYRLELLPGAVVDIYGRINDTIILDFKTSSSDEFGNIAIDVKGLDSLKQYVIHLKLGDEILRKSIIVNSSASKVSFSKLRVNSYKVELIKDDNADGKWTTGDYWQNRQPEELKRFDLEKLRQNWDLEAEVSWNESNEQKLDSLGNDSSNPLLDKPEQGESVNPKRNPPIKGGDQRDKGSPDPKGKND